MKIIGKGIVTNVYKTDRGSQYITLVDLENGGEIKFSMGGASIDMSVGSMVGFDLKVKGQSFTSKSGTRTYNLVYQDGKFTKEGG